MHITRLVVDDDAVSPVIGVVLMVSITVILASVIGVFVLEMGDNVQDTSPHTSFTFEYHDGGTGGSGCGSLGSDASVTITHDGGGIVQEDRVAVTDGESTITFDSCDSISDGSEISAGASIEPTIDDTDTIRIVWESSEGQTATLETYEAPDA